MKRFVILLSLVLCCTTGLLIANKIVSKAADSNEATLLNTYGSVIGKMGNCASLEELKNPQVLAELKKHYNSIVLENQSKPDALLQGQAKCISTSDGKGLGYVIPDGYTESTVPIIHFETLDEVMKICYENGLSMRIHTLVWHAQTPDWFFKQGYNGSGGYVSKEIMNKRMEFYIKTVVKHIQSSKYAKIVYAYDVVNEYLHAQNSGWQTIYGSPTTKSDMLKQAFTYAHEELEACDASNKVSLFYNDYNTYMDVDKIIELITYINSEKKVCDGIGMQSHLSTDFPSVESYGATIDKFAAQKYEIQITELDVGNTSEAVQADYMYKLMSTILSKKAAGANITSLTYWGYCDSVSWRRENNPLLFKTIGVPKQSYTQVIKAYTDAGYNINNDANSNDNNSNDNNNNDDSNSNNDNNNDNNPSSGDDSSQSTGLTEAEIKEAEAVFSNVNYTKSYKEDGDTNPIITQRFGADPGVMVYNDTVYVVTTNDSAGCDGSEKTQENDYSKITTINLWSSTDLINWTDHGTIQVAGANGTASWASNSWAPTMCHKKINNTEKFFIYFANSANGIGVLTSDSPTGPWKDPIGKALVSKQTANCADITWLFDPAVLVDDDQTGYLYFGGGVPDSKNADPGTARVVKLGDDMISLAGDPVKVDAPYLFEDSGINKIGDQYYYSYCSNFSTGGNNLGISNGAIEYCVSDSPMGPFTYAGEMFKNPSAFFGDGGNNHHTLIEFGGAYYLFYHTQVLKKAMGIANGYRCTQVDKVSIGSDGKIQSVTGTLEGVKDSKGSLTIKDGVIQAETMYRQAGITVKGSGDTVLTDIQAGDWSEIANVNLSNISGKQIISMKVASQKDGYIKICTNDPASKAIGYVKVLATGGEFKDAIGYIDATADKANIVLVYGTNMEVDSINLKKTAPTDNSNNEESSKDDSKQSEDDELDNEPKTADNTYISYIAIVGFVSLMGIINRKKIQRLFTR